MSESEKKEYKEKVMKILSELTGEGYSAYPVGGCVRDIHMGRTPSDCDIATNAPPEKVISIISRVGGCSVHPTGLKHGTVTIVHDAAPIEITAFRKDGGYSDHRRPDSVEFGGSLTEDLARRDFTINAMAYDTATGETIDPFGGREDIKNRVIRCVGDPVKRFGEDALRILRALRFSAVTGFDIEEKTAKAIFDLKDTLVYVSAERKYSELKKLICGKNAGNVIIKYAPVLAEVLPCISQMIGFDQKNRHHIYDLLTHTAKVVSALPEDNVYLRLAALLHDAGKPLCVTEKDGERHFYGHADISERLAREGLTALRADNAAIKKVCLLVKYHDLPLTADERSVGHMMLKLGSDIFDELLLLKRADNLAQSPEYPRTALYDEVERIKRKMIDEGRCFSLDRLAVGGKDMLALGYAGRETGVVLGELLSKVACGELENDREVLVRYAERKLK